MKTVISAVGVAAAVLAVANISAPAAGAADLTSDLGPTVLTLEGGLVGIQHLLHFTPRQLQGSLCKAPKSCTPVDYPAWPLGQYFNNLGSDELISAIDALPAGTPVTPFGHSQGGQVIYTTIRRWVADPVNAPDPSQVTWVSIGNPENAFGGVKRQDGLPPDTPYQGIEVIKQYDGWADYPTGKMNALAWLNAAAGKNNTHVWGYFDVNLNDPNNILWVPDKADGTPGNITYVFVPNDTLPLIQATGLLAPLLNPILDPILRPIIESAYDRPIGPVGVSTKPAASVPARVSATPRPVAARTAVKAAPAAVTVQRALSAAASRPAAAQRTGRTAARGAR